MNKTRPVRVFWQEGVSLKQIVFVFKAIHRVLKLAGMDNKIEVQLGDTFDPIWHQCMDTKSEFFGYYDAEKFLFDLSLEQILDDCYVIFLMKDKIFFNTIEGKKSVGGLAQNGQRAIISVGCEISAVRKNFSEIHFLIMHEVGHVFGLISDKREKEIKSSPVNQSKHCANNCVMYPTVDKKIKKNIFCSTCLRELHEYFEEE